MQSNKTKYCYPGSLQYVSNINQPPVSQDVKHFSNELIYSMPASIPASPLYLLFRHRDRFRWSFFGSNYIRNPITIRCGKLLLINGLIEDLDVYPSSSLLFTSLFYKSCCNSQIRYNSLPPYVTGWFNIPSKSQRDWLFSDVCAQR